MLMVRSVSNASKAKRGDRHVYAQRNAFIPLRSSTASTACLGRPAMGAPPFRC